MIFRGAPLVAGRIAQQCIGAPGGPKDNAPSRADRIAKSASLDGACHFENQRPRLSIW
jgi:hypothetical protein